MDVLREMDDSAIRLIRRLMRSARHAVIATLEPNTGNPIATRIGISTDHDGTPITLVSALAAHTPALLADPRCSLLVGELGKGDPLAYPRMTISAKAREIVKGTPEHARIEWRYLSHLPKSKAYVGLRRLPVFPAGTGKYQIEWWFRTRFPTGSKGLVELKPCQPRTC